MPEKLSDNSPMPFGKLHKGKPMVEVPASYLFYIYDQGWTRGALKDYILENFEVIKEQMKNEKK
jgi:uncharacterized protein (DUF3820 family)